MTELAVALLNGFEHCRVLVVGDIMLDRYIRGTAVRISPEAPVPVLLSAEQHDAPGGAANVALNIAALGGKCGLAGFVGEDEPARSLVALCSKAGIDCEAVVPAFQRPTTLKTRILSGKQQLLRIDHEITSTASEEDYRKLFRAIEAFLDSGDTDAIVVSDYAKGVTSPSFMAELFALASANGIPVFVDPKGADYAKYSGAAVVKPNRGEMTEFARKWGWPVDDPVEAAKKLREAANLTHVALTLGDQGLALVSEAQVKHIPTRAKDVYDVTGAGDTVMATLVLCLVSGMSPEDAADVANHAAAIVVGRVGSSAVGVGELIQAINDDHIGLTGRKVCTAPLLSTVVRRWREDGKKIVFTNGCFDLIHAGHTGLLQDARKLGDRLIVGLNSDDSVTRLKGPLRPLMPLDQRIAVLSALESVDAIVVYDEDTPLEMIELVKPDVLVKGGDYNRGNIVGADVVEGNGGKVEIVPITNQVSTSKIADLLSRL